MADDRKRGQRTRTLAHDGDRVTVQGFRLRVLDGPLKGTAHTSAAQRVVVGTHASADFRLEDDTLSRFHCEIAIEDGRAVVRDLGSLNGTVVDGTRVVHAYLGDKATLTLGTTRVRFQPVRVRLWR